MSTALHRSQWQMCPSDVVQDLRVARACPQDPGDCAPQMWSNLIGACTSQTIVQFTLA